MKTTLPRQGQSLEQRRKREQVMIALVVEQLAGDADDSLLLALLNNLRLIHRELSLVALFPDKGVDAAHVYFWLLVWPQLELMFEEVMQGERGAITLRYLARCQQRHGDRLFGDRVASRNAILETLGESLDEILASLGVKPAKAAAAGLQFRKRLGRLIRTHSFPGRTSVDEPLKALVQALGLSPRNTDALIRHLLQLLEGCKVLHAAGLSPLLAARRPTMPDELDQIHRELYRQARATATGAVRPGTQLLDRLAVLFKDRIGHLEPGVFLSQQARQVGSSEATRALIEHNAGQFHAYVLLEQIKSDLHVGLRPQRVGSSVKMLELWFGGDAQQWQAFFLKMPPSLFLLNAIFSSALTLIQRLDDERLWDAAKSALHRIGEAGQAPVAQREEMLALAAREQIIVLKQLLDIYHARHHLGWLAVELLAFLYAFKYKYDPGFQPHATDKLETILDDCIDERHVQHRIEYQTPFGPRKRTLVPFGADAALMMIHQYNRYVLGACEEPRQYLCNPLQRLDEIVGGALAAADTGRRMEDAAMKRCINKAFGTGKGKSIMRIGGIRPYECLRDVEFYLSALHLQAHDQLNPGLFRYLALPERLQQLILRLLSPTGYALDLQSVACVSGLDPKVGEWPR
ncbi:hypothetical protein [Pseudomonas piscis]|uniref:hypothetical protein n=1 Tax=Pseudomonas piscis TaxID=2614538 RepID=UPI0021D5CCE1|nr:hypothetical protein [Pseudomonas piscis]MCU7646216.1 hypothetical protein [Pseudomonas piscis]